MNPHGSARGAGHRTDHAAGLEPGAVDCNRDVLLDTGVVVALYATNDRHHAAARRWLAGFRGKLHSVEPILTESAHLLPSHLCGVLAQLAADGGVTVHPLGVDAYRRIATLARKYADQAPDWADLALVWLAESTGLHHIATLDVADFNVYRIHGRKRFALELLA